MSLPEMALPVAPIFIGRDPVIGLARAVDDARPAVSDTASSGTAQEKRPEPAASRPPAGSMVARFRRRLFNPLGGGLGGKPSAQAETDQPDPESLAPAGNPPKPALGRDVGFKASLAEFLLINRLRARIRPKAAQPVQSAEVLQRAEHIIYVTCRDWFGESDSRSGDLGTKL